MPILDISQSTSKVREKSGRASTGAIINFSLKISNALVTTFVQENYSAFIQSMIGGIIILK